MRPAFRPAVALAAVASLTLAGCGGGAGEETASEASQTAAPAPAPVEVTLVDYAFKGLPDTVDAGTRFTVVNKSKKEVHELVAFRLPKKEKRALKALAALPSPKLFKALGGEPVTVLLAAPGQPMIPAVGDGTLAQPGRYLVLCSIPTGADPQEYLKAAAEAQGGPPKVKGGPPHFTKGMVAEVTVR